MRLPFLRTPQQEDEPTVVAMTGVRLGDKVHFWGRHLAILLPLAARSGLSGQVTIVSPGSAELLAAAERNGLLADANATPKSGANFDLAVVHAVDAWASCLSGLLAASRPGGRLVVIAGEPAVGLLARFRHAQPGPSDADVAAAMNAAGWRRVRNVGARDGMRFTEGVRA